MNAWFKDIDRATTEAEVLASARDYCSLLNPRDLQPLPAELRTIHIENGTDITRLRERLEKGCAGLKAHASDVEKLRDLLSYLARAADRVGELRQTH
jgi:hypothetical protein